MAILIPLSREGLFAITDEDMEQSLSRHLWTSNKGYACRMDYSGPKPKIIYMARLIMDAPDGVEVDHRNGKPLDCRRENLRFATPVQNAQNRKLYSHNTSGYKGVVWVKSVRRWKAVIGKDGKQEHLGYFETPREASDAYQKAATEHFGEFQRDAAPVSEPIITKVCSRPATTAANTSGLHGISFDNGRKRWLAYIRMDKKTIRLGRFKTQEAAVSARANALSEHPTAT